MITVLLVDDHSYIRKGLRYLLELTSDMEVIGTAANGIEAVAKARLFQPNVVVIDISMPLMNGLEATKQIHESCRGTRVLTLSMYDSQEYVRSALQAGSAGYLLKEAIGNELVEAIRSVYRGKKYFSRKIASIIGPYIQENYDTWAC